MNLRRLTKILMALILVMSFSETCFADKWNSYTFTEDVALGMAELNQYCVLHDVKLEDVLWANGLDGEDLKAGVSLYLPANQVDMLSIWQNKGAWKPTALFPVTSAAAANRLKKNNDEKPEIKTEPETKTAEAPVKEVMKEITTEDLQSILDSMTKNKTKLEPKKAEEKKIEPSVNVAQAMPVEQSKPVELPKTSPTPTAKQSTPKETPAKVIASSSKPDKILTSKPKNSKSEIPGLMDPIIILSPNGDPSHGPMRLVISGDKVEVVRLPQNALPKKPSMSDFNNGFGSAPSYLPYYNITARPRSDRFIITNLNGKMMWPVNGKVSSYFGPRGKRMHEGIDIPMPAGTPIRAAKNGIVSRTGNNSTMGFRGYGNFVMLDHGNGIQTFYAHCLSVAVVPGQRIMQGQVVGYVGSTGRSTANHLHFEVRVNNKKVNPIPYLSGNSQLASR